MQKPDYKSWAKPDCNKWRKSMPIIRRITPPYPNELMYSYLYRLANYNGISSFDDFVKSFLKRIQRNSINNYESYYLYHAFFDSINIYNSPVRFFLKHSIYPYERIFLNPQQQTHLLNIYFGLYTDKYPSIITKLNGTINTIHLCPCCRDEEISSYGEYYIHREHNLPGVTCCPKHHVPLLYGKKGNGLYGAEFIKADNDITDFDIKYSIFANDLLCSELDCNITDIANAVKHKLKDIGCHARSKTFNYTDLANKIISDSMGKPFNNDTENITKFLTRNIVNLNYNDPVRWISLLCFLFQNVKSLSEYLPKQSPDTEIEFLKKTTPDYTLYSPYYRSIAMLKHNTCGRTIFTTQEGFIAGWRCYFCDETSEQQKLAELISNTNDEYTLISDFISMDQDVTIQHNKCGNTFRVSPRGFIEEGIRCKCENRIDIEEIRNSIENSGEFQLINFEDITRPITIRHKECGCEFAIHYNKFLKRPWCKVCTPAVRNHDYFVKEVEELTGSEYTVVGKYIDKNTPVAIRHNICGKTSKYLPRHFLDGIRCPNCKRNINDDDFADIVNYISYGLYKVERKETANLYCIQNTKTGKTVSVSKYKAIQELTRPTPSPILPLEKRRIDGLGTKTKNESDFEKLYHAYNDNPEAIIFMEDIAKIYPGKTYPQVKGYVNTLIRNRKLFRYATGIFTFKEDRAIKPERLITEQYIVRNGQRIGMLYGKSLAYEWSIITEKPDTLFIITNKESMEHGRAKTLYGMKIRIKGYSVGISNNNYIVIGILDIANNAWHFGWKNWQSKIKEIIKTNKLNLIHFIPYFDYYGKHTEEDIIAIFQSM